MLIKENEELKEEIEDKNFALMELAQFYEHCQKNHKNSSSNECLEETDKKNKKKRKSKSL